MDAHHDPPFQGPPTPTGAAQGDAVTIVIPTRNRRQLLLRALQSVLSQRKVECRVVVVIDGGSDDSPEAIRDLSRPEVQIISHPTSQGVSAARNAGLKVTETPWVAFLDDDDLWAPDRLNAQLSRLAENPSARWSCTSALHVDSDLSVTSYHKAPDSGDVSSEMLKANAIPGGGSGVLVSTQLARQSGGFDESISILADWDFNIRLSLRSPLASVDQPLMAYYVHLDSMYHNPNGLIAELDYLAGKYRALPGGRSLNCDRGVWLNSAARIASLLGDSRTARHLILQGVRESGLAASLKKGFNRIRPRNSKGGLVPGPVPARGTDWLYHYRAEV